MNKKSLKWTIISVGIFVLMLGLDILSKNLVVANYLKCIAKPHGVDLIPGFLSVEYTVNTNAAFGIGLGSALANRIMYICLASIASAVIIAIFVKKQKTIAAMYKVTMMLILSGAIGNLVDRIFYTPEYLHSLEVIGVAENGVVDWINFYGIWPYHFNWADSCVVVGCIMLIIYLIVEEVKDSKAKKAAEQNQISFATPSENATNETVSETTSKEEIKTGIAEENVEENLTEKAEQESASKPVKKTTTKKTTTKKTSTKKTATKTSAKKGTTK